MLLGFNIIQSNISKELSTGMEKILSPGTVHRDGKICLVLELSSGMEKILSPGTVHRDETYENFLSQGTVHMDGNIC